MLHLKTLDSSHMLMPAVGALVHRRNHIDIGQNCNQAKAAPANELILYVQGPMGVQALESRSVIRDI